MPAAATKSQICCVVLMPDLEVLYHLTVGHPDYEDLMGHRRKNVPPIVTKDHSQDEEGRC